METKKNEFTETIYKDHLITRELTGYFYSRTKNGRVLSDTLQGIKKLIDQNL